MSLSYHCKLFVELRALSLSLDTPSLLLRPRRRAGRRCCWNLEDREKQRAWQRRETPYFNSQPANPTSRGGKDPSALEPPCAPAPKLFTSRHQLFKWGTSIANIADFAKPPEKLAYSQQVVVTCTGLTWSRYTTPMFGFVKVSRTTESGWIHAFEVVMQFSCSTISLSLSSLQDGISELLNGLLHAP
ncbi:hypothetical protein Taro_008949 [Colocasia esculenta]|uniref:Mitochondrial pyruvate carrier n=1 Tax=Colocasia esculenta TaxID=4460 RepID=A0A843U505_COLES|nr:hypothetical protein [Colocasia esculenta]